MLVYFKLIIGLFHCNYRPPAAVPASDYGRGKRKVQVQVQAQAIVQVEERCVQNKSWRHFAPLARCLPNSVSARGLLRLVAHFAAKTHIPAVEEALRMNRGTIGQVYHTIRLFLMRFMACTQQRLCNGSRRLVAVLDEMYMTKVHNSAVGPYGEPTPGQTTLVLGITEFDQDTRKLTGKGVMRIIPNASAAIIRRVFQACVVPGDSRPDASQENITPVWSDEWRGYQWMDQPGTGYSRTGAVQSEGVFSDLAGRGGNPQEIIWSLCRRDCRQRFLRFPAKPGAGENGHHSAYFAEFLWRLRHTGAPSDVPERAAKAASFWRLLASLRRVHRDANWGEAAPQFDVYKVPAALVEKFDSMIPSLVHDQ